MQPELIETILVTADRQLPLLGRHLARLLTSCQALRYRCNEPAVESAIMAAVRGLHAPVRTGCACCWRATAATTSRPRRWRHCRPTRK